MHKVLIVNWNGKKDELSNRKLEFLIETRNSAKNKRQKNRIKADDDHDLNIHISFEGFQ